MMQIKACWPLVAIFFFMAPIAAQSVTKANQNEPVIAGWLESILLQPWQAELRAKLDTGAKTSSLHALDIHYFKRDGHDWVSFHTEDKKDNATLKPVELLVKRTVKIKSHHNDAAIRPVVELHFCLNGDVYHGEFSLVDRSHFNYAVLLGRGVLKQGIIVDASTTFILPIDMRRCETLFENGKQ
ncbi:MAG: hypothetical protein ACI9QV_000111 [Methylophagaceae bacterium]|jgi:hypothetical protein